jgi:hypothetical protein
MYFERAEKYSPGAGGRKLKFCKTGAGRYPKC